MSFEISLSSMSQVLFLALLLGSLQVVRVSANSLAIRPEHVRLNARSHTISLTCAADVALAGCQFRWVQGLNYTSGQLLDLSRGSQSQADPAHLHRKLTDYNYSGRGLEAGDCGVSLQVSGRMIWMIACRVRAKTGGWKYAWAALYASDRDILPNNLTNPREVVVIPGGEARVIMEAQEPLSSCGFFLPSTGSWGVDFDQGVESPDSTGRRLYIGAGLKSGQCGLAVSNVSEADNGPFRGYMETPEYKTEDRYMALVVARPPTVFTLNVVYLDTNVTATCEVQGSRPFAKISWVLGDDIIRNDENDDSQAGPQDEWRWPWMQGSIQQTLTLKLQPQHHGKDLKCRVSHIALDQPLETKIKILVTGVAANSLARSPEHVRVNTASHTVSFTCPADVALAGCQFRWVQGLNYTSGGLLDLSRGSQSQADPAHLDRDLTDYRYSGRDLEAGDCGVSLQVSGPKIWMVACRVRAKTGGWKYAWADLYATDRDLLPNNLMNPREVVVIPGGEARVIMEAREPLGSCGFFLPSSVPRNLKFDQGVESPDSTGRRLYIGAGLQSGQCGLALNNVSEADNGPFRGYMETPEYKTDDRYMALVVVRLPTALTLNLIYTDTNVTATCAVQGSRPVAKISWLLGDDIIRHDENDDTQADPQDEWRWPWMQGSIQQTLTLQLQPQHNGKDLTCRVSHVALDQPLEAKTTVYRSQL